MTDNDNIIIEQLFSEARKTEIEDNGFSHRVMRSLPDTIAPISRHTIIISRLWTFFAWPSVLRSRSLSIFGNWRQHTLKCLCAHCQHTTRQAFAMHR